MNFIRVFARHCHRGNVISNLTETVSGLMVSHENYDHEFYLNFENFDEICENIKSRGMEQEFVDLMKMRETNDYVKDPNGFSQLIQRYISQMPNRLNPIWFDRKSDFYTVEVIGSAQKFDFDPQTMETLMQKLGLLYLSERNYGNLGIVAGNRSYALLGDLTRLEHAVMRWTLKTLINDYHFTPVMVPQLVYDEVIKGCGFNPHGHRSQVYGLHGDDRVCLTGTSEIPLAALNIGEIFDEDQLPKKYCALSRCYRAEAKTTKEKSGLYRVHCFNKVEMFAVTSEDQSDSTLEDFITIQRSLYEQLGLHFRIVDMPPHELGVPASRKFDCEVWFSGRKSWGEISSASNCTDYQSRRLNIKYRTLALNEETNEIFKDRYVHTVNATACACPRILVAICEHYQTLSGHVHIPEVLQPFMGGQKIIDQKLNLFEIK